MFRNITFLGLLLASLFGKAQTFSKTPLITGLPLGIAFDFSSDGRIFTTQKGGFAPQAADAGIRVYDAAGNFLSEFYDLSDSIHASGEYGLLGIAVDPNFSQNHYVYTYYTYSDDPANGGDIHIRVQRFTEQNNIGVQPVILMDLDVLDTMARNHVAGNIHFRPSDSTHIYISVGDMRTDQLNYPAMIDNPYGKILRISKFPNAGPPSDNPFYDDGNPTVGNCDYIWAYGLRNTFDFCFGPNDSLYATENGTTLYDEVNLITRGGFYGWPSCEGAFDSDTSTLPCHAANAIDPIAVFGFPLPALTGVLFYTGTTWSAQQNHLITGDFNHADLTDLTFGNAPVCDTIISSAFWIDASMIAGITTLKQGPQGCIYVLELGDTVTGGIYMICPDANTITENTVQNYLFVSGPNPFAENTTITYTLESSSHVRLSIYDATGREVAVPVDEVEASGNHTVELNTQKYGLSAGIYICVLHSDQFSQSAQLIVE